MIQLGMDKDSVQRILGKPTDLMKEPFDEVSFEVWDYSNADKMPLGFISFDPITQKVAAMTQQFFPNDNIDLNSFKSSRFMGISFVPYKPCPKEGVVNIGKVRDSRNILVNKEEGIFLIEKDKKVLALSRSVPTLTELKINRLYSRCPKLQPPQSPK